MIRWQESFAVLYETAEKTFILGDPEVGLIRRTPQSFAEAWGEDGEVLLLETTKETPQQKFGLQWFWPSIVKYKWVLIEVFVASFFVQLFGLANPLMVQIIIDKVIVQNSIDTLQVLGIFLVIVAVFEAILSSLRMYLFIDTTNRIDMTLGAEIIDHLFRLPLRYFDRRPVGRTVKPYQRAGKYSPVPHRYSPDGGTRRRLFGGVHRGHVHLQLAANSGGPGDDSVFCHPDPFCRPHCAAAAAGQGRKERRYPGPAGGVAVGVFKPLRPRTLSCAFAGSGRSATLSTLVLVSIPCSLLPRLTRPATF